MTKSRGFTVVEILVICAVIGILFTIVTVTWNTVLRDSEDDTRLAEHNEWVGRFQTYRAQRAIFPDLPVGTNACLGRDFPENRCGNGINATAPQTAQLLDELGKIGSLPEYPRKKVNTYNGPWATYPTTTNIRVYHSYRNSTCPSGTVQDTAYSGGTVCYIELQK